MNGARVWRSPNFNARAVGKPIAYVVVHYTDMESAEAALTRLCDPATQVSAHDVIDEDGTLYELVDAQQRAWHAGVSFWQGERDMNSVSVGIELVNPGHRCGYRPFPPTQITALIERLRHYEKLAAFLPENVLGHSDVAPGRRPDPGELFPWAELARHGFGLWASPEPADFAPSPNPDDEARALLNRIGYDPTVALPDVLHAFQQHFTPQNLTSTADATTLASLRAIRRLK
jgi:N-acetylmuramoyl-L-alanine amidase